MFHMKNYRLLVWMDAELRQQMEAAAGKVGVSMAEYCRQALSHALLEGDIVVPRKAAKAREKRLDQFFEAVA